MPILIPSDTRQALGGGQLPDCTSRALFATRFTDPAAKEAARKKWFEDLIRLKAEGTAPAVDWLPEKAQVLHARLMARMMVNLAGGAMENANVLLDWRGYPYIPGSAVKGCARRMALQALHDWPENGASEASDPTAPCRQGFSSKAEMLAAIARVFGWVGQDWENGKNRDRKTGEETTWKSDFAWSCHGDAEVMRTARQLAGAAESFGGTVAFLDARPNRDPGLELDVVTPHHTRYYESKDPDAVATDTEEPVPVLFPAIRSQSQNGFFTFPLISLRKVDEHLLGFAKMVLQSGLEIFGLGAKTNAGYGWFDASEAFQKEVQSKIQARQQAIQAQEEGSSHKGCEGRGKRTHYRRD